MLIAIYEVNCFFLIEWPIIWFEEVNYKPWIYLLEKLWNLLKIDRTYPIVWDVTEAIIRLEVNYLCQDISY